jgi:flagellar biosynthesis/type III secretory pathway protein FliH
LIDAAYHEGLEEGYREAAEDGYEDFTVDNFMSVAAASLFKETQTYKQKRTLESIIF